MMLQIISGLPGKAEIKNTVVTVNRLEVN